MTGNAKSAAQVVFIASSFPRQCQIHAPTAHIVQLNLSMILECRLDGDKKLNVSTDSLHARVVLIKLQTVWHRSPGNGPVHWLQGVLK